MENINSLTVNKDRHFTVDLALRSPLLGISKQEIKFMTVGLVGFLVIMAFSDARHATGNWKINRIFESKIN